MNVPPLRAIRRRTAPRRRAVLGLVIANLPFGSAVIEVKDAHLDAVAGARPLGRALDQRRAARGLLLHRRGRAEARARHRRAQLASRAMLPAIAALGGVIVPAAIFLAFTAGTPDGRRLADPDGDRHRVRARRARGIRTVPADARAHLPPRARGARRPHRDPHHRLLLHDDADLASLGFAAIAIALFGAVSRVVKPRSNWILSRRPQWPITLLLVVLAVLAWYFVYRSGVTRRSRASPSGS